MKYLYIILILPFLLFSSSCQEDYLELLPKDQLTETTTFTTNANFENLCLGILQYLPGLLGCSGHHQKGYGQRPDG